MKQKFKWLLALFAMVASVNLMAAETSVLISSFSTSGKIGNIFAYSITKNNGTNDPYTTSGNLRMYYDNSGGSQGNLFTITVPDGYTITKVVITATGTSYTPPVKYNVDGGSDLSGSWSSTTMTISSISAKESFAFRNAGTESNTQLRPSKVQVFYTENAGCSKEVTVSKGTITGSGDITISATEVCADGEGGSVTVTPVPAAHYHCTGVTATKGSVSSPDAQGKYTVSGIKENTSISATFAEDAKVNVSWKVNGGNATGGSSVAYIGSHVEELPTTPSSELCDGSKEFVGWTNAPVTDGNKPSILFKAADKAPIVEGNGDITYYAVFANKTGGVEGYKLVSDLTENETYIFVSSNAAGAAYALTATGLPTNNGNASAVAVTVTSANSDFLVADYNEVIEFVYLGEEQYPDKDFYVKVLEIAASKTHEKLVVNGSGLAKVTANYKAFWDNDGRGLYGSNSGNTTQYTVYYDDGNFTKGSPNDGSRVYAYEKVSANYSGYATSCASPKITVAAGANGSVTLYDENLDIVADGYANFPQGSIITIEATPSSDAYEFEKWTISGDGADATWNEGSSANSDLAEVVVGSKDATFTASFRAKTTKYTIALFSNDNVKGSAAFDDNSDEAELATGDQVGIKAINNDPTLYIFDKWTIEDGDATIDDVNNPNATLTCGSEDAIVQANFMDLPKYTVKFYANDDDAEPTSTEDVISGHKISSFPAVTSCDPSLVSLVGWTNAKVTKQASAPETLYKTIEDVPAITEATTLYAVWATVKSDEGTITWNINGVVTSADGGTNVNTALKTSSIDPATETGVWTAVASGSYAATASGKAQLGSNSYKFNGTITLSGTKIPSGATIEQIDLTATSSATDANPYSVTATVGGIAFGTAQSLSSGNANCQWKPTTGVVGNTIVISTTCGYNKNIVVSAISVKYSYVSAKDFTTKCETPTIVANPQFVTPEGKYCGEVDVELSQAAGVDIYYTKDNTNPTKSSSKYTSPIEVTSTTTIKAIAIDANNNSSDVVEATYTIPTKSYADMAAVLAETSTTEVEGCIYFDEWIVTGKTNSTVYLANKDNTLGVIISESNHGFAAGNKLSGNVVGRVKKNSNGTVQISEVVASDFAEIGTGSVTAQEVSIADLTVADQGRLVTINGVTANKSSNTDVTLTDASSNSITYYNTFTTNPTLTKDAKYNVTGVVFFYNSTKEISARGTDDVEWIYTQLTAPTLNAATEIGTTKATISWTPAADAANVSSYSITYNELQVTNISNDATSYTFSGLAAGTNYTCSIVAVGDGVTYKTSVASNEVQFETLDSDTKWSIIYHVANGTAPTSPIEVADGTPFVYPNVTDVDCAEYQFIGWTTDANYAGGSQKPADIKEAGETSGNISGPVNLYAVYGMTSSKKTAFDDFVADADMTSAQFVIAAKVGENYYALPNNLDTNAGTKDPKSITLNQDGEVITNLDATKVTFIKNGSNFKVNLSSTNYLYWTSSTSIGQHALPNPVTNAYLWSVSSASTAGSYHMVNVGDGTRALIYRTSSYNKFGAYNTTVNGTEYYDVELIPVVISENDYTIKPDCKSIPTLALKSSLGNEFNLVEIDGNKATTTITVAEGSQSDGELTLSVSDLYTGVTFDNIAKTVTFSAAGTYVVKATQAATATWAEAEASITLTVKKSIITITYNGNAEGVTNVPEPQQVLQDETFEVKSGAEMVNGQNAFVKWNTASDESGDDYQAGANASFTASTTLYAVWQPAKKITVPTFEGGSISVTPQFALPNTDITVTVNPDPGYIVKKLTYVGDESGEEHKIYSNSFSMPEEDVTISALFVKGAMYEIATSDGAVTSTGNLPTGSEGVFETTYTAGSDKTQITSGNTWTFTIKGYEGKVIRSIILNLQSNKTSGKGSLTITQGTRTLVNQEDADFDKWFGGQNWSTKHFREVTMPMDWTYVNTDEEIVITIVGTYNSLYCNSIFVDWADGYGRDMSNGYMGTHCYPFDIAAGDCKGARFYEIAYRIGDTRIYFDQVDHVEAGVPYLVVPEEGGSLLVAVVTNYTASEKPATNKNGFYGSYVEKDLDANSGLYIVYNNEFRLAGEYVAVGANRAYIKLEEVATNDPNPQAPRRISLRNSETGAATGINNIREEFGNPNRAMKVFHNGNIYFIRDSKIYNAQGVELK